MVKQLNDQVQVTGFNRGDGQERAQRKNRDKTIKNMMANLGPTIEKAMLSLAGRATENCWNMALLLMLELSP